MVPSPPNSTAQSFLLLLHWTVHGSSLLQLQGLQRWKPALTQHLCSNPRTSYIYCSDSQPHKFFWKMRANNKPVQWAVVNTPKKAAWPTDQIWLLRAGRPHFSSRIPSPILLRSTLWCNCYENALVLILISKQSLCPDIKTHYQDYRHFWSISTVSR